MDYTLTRAPDILTLTTPTPYVRMVYTGLWTADNLTPAAEQAVALLAAAALYDQLAGSTIDPLQSTRFSQLANNYRQQYLGIAPHNCGVYATPTKLLNRFGATELAQLCKIPQADLFAQQILGQQSSPTVYKPEETMKAKAAVSLLCQACVDADAYITIYLSRYTTPIPRPLVDVATNAACDLARWQLWDKGELTADNVVQRRYESATKLLEDVRDGLVRTGDEQGNFVQMVNTPRRSW